MSDMPKNASDAMDDWLRQKVAPTYDAMKADPARAVSVESAFGLVRDRHAERIKVRL